MASSPSTITFSLRKKDHALIRVTGMKQSTDFIVALPDSTRYLYIGLTGQNCHISGYSVNRETEECPNDYIPRIAEEISYINVPDGDIPNLQVDGDRSDFSEGVLLEDSLEISFHTMSLPTSRLVWHCPFVMLFNSDNGNVGGPNYRVYNMVKFNGECDDSNDHSKNSIILKKKSDFSGWEDWKEVNKKGLDCQVSIKKDGNQVIVTTENMGISIRSTSTISEDISRIYVALTGDQVALTNIRIKR